MNGNKSYFGQDREWRDKYGAICKVSHPNTDLTICWRIPKDLKDNETISFEFWDNKTGKSKLIKALTYNEAYEEYIQH